MKREKIFIRSVTVLIIVVVLLCLNVFVQQKIIKTYTYTELENRGYTAQEKEKWNCSVTCAEDSADNAYVTTYSNERVVSSTGVLSLQNQNDFDIVVHLLTNGQQERTAEIPAGGVSILYELIEGVEYTVGTHADVPEGTEIFLMVYEGKNAEVY